jgi:predicted RNA-binding protein
MKKYWVNTVSFDHLQKGIEGGFTQADHGKAVNIKKLSKDDFIVFYSPKTRFENGELLQKFTAVGKVMDTETYQVEMNPAFHPWRRKLEFIKCQQVPVKDLIDKLEFIKDKKKWGFPFRRGLFQISGNDFKLIADAMNVEL